MSAVSIKPIKDERPWGNFLKFTENQPSTVKIITVNPGEILSLQKHSNRDEFNHVVSGAGFVTIGEEKVAVKAGSECFVPRGTLHRIEAGSTPLVLLEISLGNFDESDIERLEDKYGRIT